MSGCIRVETNSGWRARSTLAKSQECAFGFPLCLLCVPWAADSAKLCTGNTTAHVRAQTSCLTLEHLCYTMFVERESSTARGLAFAMDYLFGFHNSERLPIARPQPLADGLVHGGAAAFPALHFTDRDPREAAASLHSVPRASLWDPLPYNRASAYAHRISHKATSSRHCAPRRMSGGGTHSRDVGLSCISQYGPRSCSSGVAYAHRIEPHLNSARSRDARGLLTLALPLLNRRCAPARTQVTIN